MKKYTVTDITKKCGVSKRTVHYYIGRGLIPSADRDSNGFFYTDEHVVKIKYIRWLADKHISLQGIAFQMKGKTCDALQNEMDSRAESAHFDMAKENKAMDLYLKKTVVPGLEMHLSMEVYKTLEHKMDVLTRYINKLIQEK